jgi:hypothetical protein
MSTPLESLSEAQMNGPPADEERVRRILSDLNGNNEAPRIITEPPLNPGPLRMDPGTARANVIGNSTPTMADFQAMFQQMAPGMSVAHPPTAVAVPKPETNWRDYFFQMLRAPVAVAVIVFFLNLPVTTSILSRYASWMYLSNGEISIVGLLLKALGAGVLFAMYQTVVAFIDK